MTENATASETTYRVAGMTCGGCVRSLTSALREALPGHAIEVLLDPGTVTVGGPHDSSDVENAVEDAGFDFEGVA